MANTWSRGSRSVRPRSFQEVLPDNVVEIQFIVVSREREEASFRRSERWSPGVEARVGSACVQTRE